MAASEHAAHVVENMAELTKEQSSGKVIILDVFATCVWKGFLGLSS